MTIYTSCGEAQVYQPYSPGASVAISLPRGKDDGGCVMCTQFFNHAGDTELQKMEQMLIPGQK